MKTWAYMISLKNAVMALFQIRKVRSQASHRSQHNDQRRQAEITSL